MSFKPISPHSVLSFYLRFNFFTKEPKIKYPELANNNLHIWELGEVFKVVGGLQNTSIRNKYRLLAPKEIVAIFETANVPIESRPTSVSGNANIVAAMNGPMAHIYSMIGTDNKTVGEIAEVFRIMLGGLYPEEAVRWLGFANKFEYFKLKSQSVGRLGKSVDKILIRKTDGNYYLFNGLDSTGQPVATAVSNLPEPDYVSAVNRINGMNDKDRSGDVVLIMKDDTKGLAADRYSTAYACKSWHGSLNPSDSYVPFVIAYPGGNNNEIDQIISKNTVCKADYSACRENWKLPNIVKEIISQQYK